MKSETQIKSFIEGLQEAHDKIEEKLMCKDKIPEIGELATAYKEKLEIAAQMRILKWVISEPGAKIPDFMPQAMKDRNLGSF